MESNPSAPPRTFLRWPPPGLERVQGDLWRVAGIGALAGAVLVLPLLFVLTREQDLASLGPFADAWWLILLFGVAGLAAAMDALGTTKRILTRTASALEEGYDLRTVLYVLADRRRDMGFLLQGGRHFSEMDVRDQATVATLRVLGVTALAAGGLWMSAALGVMLLLIPRTAIGPTTLWVTTLLPAGIMYAVGAVAVTLEDGRVRKARKKWYTKPWSADFVADDVEAWRAEIAAHGDAGLLGGVNPGRAPLVRRLGIVTVCVAILVAIPVFTLVPTSAVGPILAMVAVPTFQRVQERAAEAEGYRPYRVEPFENSSPQEAGEVLHSLLAVGAGNPVVTEGVRPPARTYDTDWIPGDPLHNPLGVDPQRWPDTIFAAVIAGPSPELLGFLEEVASHEAHADMAWLARAQSIDVAYGRWTDTFPASMSLASLPIPRYGGLRQGAWAHLALAANELAEGRPEAAEEAIKEVISVGLLLGDQGVTLIDNLIGHTVAITGGRALEHFYDATGQDQKRAQVLAVREAIQRATRRVHHTQVEGVESMVRSLPPVVLDTTAVVGLRWEAFILTATLTPCLNLQRMVFGPDEDYAAFVRRARGGLVRWPSEEKLFDLAENGYLPAGPEGERGILGRVLSVAMRSGPGTCGNVLSQAQSLGQIM